MACHHYCTQQLYTVYSDTAATAAGTAAATASTMRCHWYKLVAAVVALLQLLWLLIDKREREAVKRSQGLIHVFIVR
jgi:hypothetical protein